jgi:uncharacterized protein (DUF1697 family)
LERTLKLAAFLRGMNLGNRRISNADLRSEFESLGFESVATFRASGNVVFEASREPRAELIERIEEGLREGLGYPVPTMLRSEAELGEIVRREPFEPTAIAASKGKLQVSLLASPPSAAARKSVLAHATDDDLLAFGVAELFWLPSGGVSDSDLDLKSIDKQLGPATMRTKGTIDQLHARFMVSE